MIFSFAVKIYILTHLFTLSGLRHVVACKLRFLTHATRLPTSQVFKHNTHKSHVFPVYILLSKGTKTLSLVQIDLGLMLHLEKMMIYSGDNYCAMNYSNNSLYSQS